MPTLPVVLWLKSCVNGPSNPPVCAPLGVLKSQMGSQRKPCEISYEKSPFFFAHNIIPSIVFFALFFIFLPPSLHDRNSDPGPLKQAFLPRPHYGTYGRRLPSYREKGTTRASLVDSHRIPAAVFCRLTVVGPIDTGQKATRAI